ncbi:hypothetical protein [Actinokineospora xionganensis]|nr:hypothetical protein [Actinokineospora xionganensis]
MTMTNYTDVAALSGVYLEDSYILAIDDTPGALRFKGEFVLIEHHPAYRAPTPGEQYCYADGWLVIPNTTRVEWNRRSTQHFTDAAGEEDLGNIDYLHRVDDHWLIGGDWGEVRAYTTDDPRLVLTPSAES